MQQVDVAIIGAGPSGMAAALQLKRFGHNSLLFEKSESDSLLKNAWRVENYLGFPQGKSGPELLAIFNEQLQAYDIASLTTEVKQLSYNSRKNVFTITTTDSIHYAKYVIVASGTKPKREQILETASASIKQRIYFEVYSLLNISNKKLIIIGAGDAAFDAALNLAANNQIMVMNRSCKTSALPLLISKAAVQQNIIYKENYSLQQITAGTDRALAVKFANGKNRVIIVADFLLAAIGRIPQKDFYTPELIAMEKELIAKGLLYLAGDVKNDIYRQISIAVADGIYTAMKINKLIRG